MSNQDCKNSDSVSRVLEECSICKHVLATGTEQVVILTKDAKRVCEHFFHKKCVEFFQENDIHKCPFCLLHFNGLAVLPNIDTNAEGWFNFVDFDKVGTLSYENILDVLRASIHIDHRRLAAELPSNFETWDTNGDNRLSFDEMMAEGTGLVSWARQFLPTAPDYSKIPDIKTEKSAWFEFWDTDKNGRLDKEEVVRALLKTFHLRSTLSEMLRIRMIVDAMWRHFDPDGSGDIDTEEFCKADGFDEFVTVHLSYDTKR